MASLNNWDSLSNEPLMPYKNTWRRCIAPRNCLLNTENSLQWATVQETMIQGGNWCSLVGEAISQSLKGCWIKFGFSSSHWRLFTLSLTVEVTSAASVWVEVFGKKKKKSKISQLFALKQKKTFIKIPRLNITDTFKWWDFKTQHKSQKYFELLYIICSECTPNEEGSLSVFPCF